MKITYCDGCKEKVDRPNSFSIPCHLWSKRFEMGYVDLDFNRVSGKLDVLDLCNECMNNAYSAAVKSIENKRE